MYIAVDTAQSKFAASSKVTRITMQLSSSFDAQAHWSHFFPVPHGFLNGAWLWNEWM